jgi:hypothetical protein
VRTKTEEFIDDQIARDRAHLKWIDSQTEMHMRFAQDCADRAQKENAAIMADAREYGRCISLGLACESVRIRLNAAKDRADMELRAQARHSTEYFRLLGMRVQALSDLYLHEGHSIGLCSLREVQREVAK